MRDTPIGMWIFGSLFVFSGLVVLSIPFVSTAWSGFVLWERAAVVAIGAGHLFGGSWSVWRYVSTVTTFDRVSNEGVHIVRRPLSPRSRVTTFKVDEARAIEIVRTIDSDGDPVFQLRLWVAESRVMWLQGQPAYGESAAQSAAARIRKALGLPEAT